RGKPRTICPCCTRRAARCRGSSKRCCEKRCGASRRAATRAPRSSAERSSRPRGSCGGWLCFCGGTEPAQSVAITPCARRGLRRQHRSDVVGGKQQSPTVQCHCVEYSAIRSLTHPPRPSPTPPLARRALCASRGTLRLIHFERRQTIRNVAADGVQNPVNHAGSQLVSCGGHGRLRRPRVGDGIVRLERPNRAAAVAADGVENAVNDSDTQAISPCRQRRLRPPHVGDGIVRL